MEMGRHKGGQIGSKLDQQLRLISRRRQSEFAASGHKPLNELLPMYLRWPVQRVTAAMSNPREAGASLLRRFRRQARPFSKMARRSAS